MRTASSASANCLVQKGHVVAWGGGVEDIAGVGHFPPRVRPLLVSAHVWVFLFTRVLRFSSTTTPEVNRTRFLSSVYYKYNSEFYSYGEHCQRALSESIVSTGNTCLEGISGPLMNGNAVI